MKDTDCKFLWPEFRDNMRVLRRIFHARSSRNYRLLAGVPWRSEVISHEELFIDLHDHLPPEIICEHELLICRL